MPLKLIFVIYLYCHNTNALLIALKLIMKKGVYTNSKMTEKEILAIYEKKYIKLSQIPGKNFFWSYDYYNFKDVLSEEEFRTALKIRNRKKQRRNRCFKKLEPILNEYIESFIENGEYCTLVFGTCTFNNDALKLKEETRTKYINKWLKEHFKIALVNIDYGLKNEREHHHFIGLTYETMLPNGKKSKKGFPMYELTDKTYKMGFEPNLEIVNLGQLEERKLSNYLVKINFHSNKITTKNRRIRVIKKT